MFVGGFDSFPPSEPPWSATGESWGNAIGVAYCAFFFASRSRLEMTCSEPHFCLRIIRGALKGKGGYSEPRELKRGTSSEMLGRDILKVELKNFYLVSYVPTAFSKRQTVCYHGLQPLETPRTPDLYDTRYLLLSNLLDSFLP